MKAAVLFTVKIFLLNALIYFFAMSLVSYFWAPEYDLQYILLASVLPSFFITGIHVYKHIREVKKLHTGGLKNEDFKVHQVLTLQLPLTKVQVLAKLQTNFPSKEWEMREEADTIKLKTSYSWKSYGEKVQIQIKKLNQELSEIMVESKPTNLLTFLDYGKNQENILYLQKLLAA